MSNGNIDETLPKRVAKSAGKTDKELWFEAVADWLLEAGQSIATHDEGVITLRYQLRRGTPDHPQKRFILTGDVSPRIQLNWIVEQRKPI